MIRAVLFDFDGTLTRPGAMDFRAVRALVGCPPNSHVLEYIDGLPTEEEKRKARGILEERELDAARRSVPNEGAEELIGLLRAAGMARGIISRNSRASIVEALKNFDGVGWDDFQVVLSRENCGRPKPNPDGIFLAAKALGMEPREILVVGDFVLDIEAGSRAGAPTALITNGSIVPEMGVVPDHVIGTLLELRGILGV